ncbi:MAG: DUF2877 domain-containing protein [Chloroflexi bacterium]|nr:DUF2877 domain-containing protein [Chloroflexota bacterium]
MKIFSLGIPLARWLTRRHASRVFARFDATIQFESRDGLLWAITTRDNPGAYRAMVDALPDWAVIARSDFCDEAISALLIGDCFAHTARNDARVLWDPRPRSRTLHEYERVIAAWEIALAMHDLPDALGFWDLLAENWEQIRDGLHQRDVAHLRGIFARLIGRGPGLTPTGDDFAQALLVTLRTGDAADRAAFRALARAIVPVLPNTTRASQQFLREALSGYAFGALKNLLDELPNLSPVTMQKLLRVGATSGHAYTLGVLMGLDSTL